MNEEKSYAQVYWSAAWGGDLPPSDSENYKATQDGVQAVISEFLHRKQQMSDAINDVISERARQIAEEGWSLEHDDLHDDGELAKASACYALGSLLPYWPWSCAWWKPKNRRANMVKAAALLIAEIERLDRIPKKVSKPK